MFNDQELVKISEAINGTWLLVNNQALSEIALDIFLDDVDGYSFVAVMTAIRNARKQAKGRISIGDIMQHLDNLDGRPSWEEAWATASQSLDEYTTVVWTAETAEAFGVASPLLDIGDKFNAAKAFKEKYDSLVSDNRLNQKPVAWIANIGTDSGSRQQVIQQAIAEGKFSKEQALHLLPNHKPVAKGTYEAIKTTVSLMIENKGANVGHHELDKVAAIKRAGELQQARIAELKKAAQINESSRNDGTKSKRDSLAIFEDAERLGVFTSDSERKAWCAKAANGDSMKDLQVMMLAKRQELKMAGAA